MRHKHEQAMLRYLDLPILLIIAALGIISIIAISSAQYNIPSYANKQMIFYGVGFAAIVVTLLIDYRRIGKFAYVFYGIGVLLLVLLYVPGMAVDPAQTKGAQSWLKVGGSQFQPAEFMKIFIILALAKVLADRKEVKLSNWKTLFLTAFLFLVPFGLIYKQPDLGTALILLAIISSILLVAGLDWRIIVTAVLLIALMVGGVLYLYFFNMPLLEKVLEDHQISRITSFVDPYSDPGDSGYHLIQAMIAIGSGQLLGKGYQQGTQVHGEWVPEPHNDFIFAVIAEEFGFVGVSILLCLFIYLIYRMVHIALAAQDFFGAYLVAGVIGLLVFQTFQNIGMTVGLMPITGINLPFISYGGSSLLMTMVAVGLVLNVGMRRKKILFYNTE